MSSKDKDKKDDICERSDCDWKLISKEKITYICLRCKKKWPPDPCPGPTPPPPPPPLLIFLIALAVALVISLILDSVDSAESPSYKPIHWRDDCCSTRY